MNRPPILTAVPDSARRPMTETETGIMVTAMVAKPQPVTAEQLPAAVLALGVFVPDKFEQFTEAQVLMKRLNCAPKDMLFDPGMVALACIMSTNVGRAVLWAWTLFRRTVELSRPYTLSDFADDFPMGPPTDDGQREIWDAQKGDFPASIFGWATDNALDVRETWSVEESADA
jgi:hypothetical protein